MIKKVEMYSITCDGCGKLFEARLSGFTCFNDTDLLGFEAESDGWLLKDGDGKSESDKQYCPVCHTYDDCDSIHWAEDLQPGDKCLATIRHQTDGTKNIHNAEIIVVHNLRLKSQIEGFYNGNHEHIPYNDLTKI